ncbi:MAG: flagellar FliL protein [Flavobacteriales bacterium]
MLKKLNVLSSPLFVTKMFAAQMFVILMFVAISSQTVFAQDEASEGEAVEDVESVEGEDVAPVAAIYIPLKPQFVVNFGGGTKNRFLKAEVTLRLSNSSAASAVRHHMPYIRNNIVMLFSAQNDESLESQDGREAMRLEALKQVRDILKREDNMEPEAVVDVLFNALTWHG